MVSMRLIKPNELYAGLPQGWWLKNYWEYAYPLVLRQETKDPPPDPDENQFGPVMYAAGKYAHAFEDSSPLVRLDGDNEIYHMQDARRGILIPFVKFIALESDGDGSSFAQLRNVAESLALDSNVKVDFEIKSGGKSKGKQTINAKNAMEYYCESFPIDLHSPTGGEPGFTESKTNKAISASFMAIFEPQEEGEYVIDVDAEYRLRDEKNSRKYGPLHDHYKIIVSSQLQQSGM
jgi:hypothetical protein